MSWEGESPHDEIEVPPLSPVCPGCGRDRLTACPVCGTTGGVNFYDAGAAMVDAEEPEEGDARMLICQMCDEAFVPEYPRLCEWCGHEFGEGTQIAAPADPLEMTNVRVIATVAGLIGLLLCVAAYFAVMF